jgi:predicted transcriptional regulator
MSTITIELDKERLARLKAWAKEAGVPAEELASSLLEQQLHEEAADDFTPDQRVAIEAGLAAIERGDVVPHDEVFAKLEARYRK